MNHIKTFNEEIKFRDFFKLPKDVKLASLGDFQKRLKNSLEDTHKSKILDEEEQKKALEYEKKIRDIDNMIFKDQQEFLKEWKETCKDIKNCLLDIKDFCDSFEETSITDNKYSCLFYINTGYIKDSRTGAVSFKVDDNVSTLFKHISEAREYLKSVDDEVIMIVKFSTEYISLSFVKPTDLYTEVRGRRPDRFMKYLHNK